MDGMELVISEGLPASLWGVNGIVKGHTPLVILCQKQHKHSACELPKLLCFPPAPPVSQERWINTESNDSKLRICTHRDTGLSFTIYSLSILSVVDARAAVHVNKLGFVYQDDANYNLCHWKREDGCLITTSDAV